MYCKLLWILDGVIVEGVLTRNFQKEDICLAIFYSVVVTQLGAAGYGKLTLHDGNNQIGEGGNKVQNAVLKNNVLK